MQSASAVGQTSGLQRVRKVAIFDDDETQRRAIGFTLRDACYEPIAAEQENLSIAAYIDWMKTVGADAAICDSRLRTHGFADFDGAELAAACYQEGIPAVLVTTFFDQDIETVIRPFRAQLPVVRSRDDLGDADAIRSAIEFCVREVIQEYFDESRRVYPALLYVKALRNSGEIRMVDVIVPQWNSDHAISIALGIVPKEIRTKVKEGAVLLGNINLGADTAHDLFVTDIREAPEVDAEDGLG